MPYSDEEFEQAIKAAQQAKASFKLAKETAERLTREENARHEAAKAKIEAGYAFDPNKGTTVFPTFWQRKFAGAWKTPHLAAEFAKHRYRLRRIELTRLVGPTEDLKEAESHAHQLLDRQIDTPPEHFTTPKGGEEG